jgi:hypothetical protein
METERALGTTRASQTPSMETVGEVRAWRTRLPWRERGRGRIPWREWMRTRIRGRGWLGRRSGVEDPSMETERGVWTRTWIQGRGWLRRGSRGGGGGPFHGDRAGSVDADADPGQRIAGTWIWGRRWRTLPWRPSGERGHGRGSGAEDGWDADPGRRWRTLRWRAWARIKSRVADADRLRRWMTLPWRSGYRRLPRRERGWGTQSTSRIHRPWRAWAWREPDAVI